MLRALHKEIPALRDITYNIHNGGAEIVRLIDYIVGRVSGSILRLILHGIDANKSGRLPRILSMIINLDLRRLQTVQEIHSNI